MRPNPSAFAATEPRKKSNSPETQLDYFLSGAAKLRRNNSGAARSTAISGDASGSNPTTAPGSSTIVGSKTSPDFYNSGVPLDMPNMDMRTGAPAGYEAQNLEGGRHSGPDQTNLSVEKPEASFIHKLRDLLSPKGFALFIKEMPAAPSFGCKNAQSANPIAKNLKRQENKHAIHFQFTKKWSKLLGKFRLLKKHSSCYIQRVSICDIDECPVRTRNVHRLSASRAICKVQVFALRVGYKFVDKDLVNLQQSQDKSYEGMNGRELAALAREYHYEKYELSKYRTKLNRELKQVSALADYRRNKHAHEAFYYKEKPKVALENFNVKPRYGLDTVLFYPEEKPVYNLPMDKKPRPRNSRVQETKLNQQRTQKTAPKVGVMKSKVQFKVPEAKTFETRVAKERVAKERVAEVKVPEVKVAEVKVAEVKVAEVKVAEVKVAEVKVPKVKVPKERIPEVKVPKVKVPKERVPEVKVPKVKVPETRITETRVTQTRVPDTTVPNTTVPEFRYPEFKVPEFNVPDSIVPEFRVPEFRYPGFKIPDVRALESSVSTLSIPEANPSIKVPVKAPVKAPVKFQVQSTLPKSIANSSISDHGDKVIAEIEEVIPELPGPSKKEPANCLITINTGKSQPGIASRKAALFNQATKPTGVSPNKIPADIKVALKVKSEILNEKFNVKGPIKKLDFKKYQPVGTVLETEILPSKAISPQKTASPQKIDKNSTLSIVKSIVSAIASPVQNPCETQLDRWLQKPKSQLWIQLDMEALLVPQLNKNTFELQCLTVDLKILCKTETENKINEYLAYLRLVVSVEKSEETMRFGNIDKSSNVAQGSSSKMRPSTGPLSQLQAVVRGQDCVMNQYKKKFLAQFDIHDRIETYLLSLLKSLEGVGNMFVNLCTDLANNGRAHDNLADYEHKFYALMEDMGEMEKMDVTAKESIDKIKSGFTLSLVKVIRGHADAYDVKEKYQQSFHQVWVQKLGRQPLTPGELEKEIGCLSLENQRGFFEDCLHLKAYDVLSQKLDRIEALYESVSRARIHLHLTFGEITSRFMRHIQEGHGSSKRSTETK